MFEELWIVKNSLCYYYKSWTNSPLALDSDLFSGFFSAFNSFQEEVFPNQFVNYIDFIESRLLFLKFKDIFIIVRDNINKPLNRSLLQLNNLTVEIISQIEFSDQLNPILLADEGKAYSVDLVTELLNPIVEDTIQSLNAMDESTTKFDSMAIINILRELNYTILLVSKTELLENYPIPNNLEWLYRLTISNKPINPLTLELINYEIIHSFVKNYFSYLADNIKKYRLPVRNIERIEFFNGLMKFLVVNREILNKFRLTDVYIANILSGVVY